MGQYTENILASIGKLLFGSKLKKHIRNLHRDLKEDPELLATVDSLTYNLDEFERKMKSLCDRVPDSALCKGKTRFSKSNFRK